MMVLIEVSESISPRTGKLNVCSRIHSFGFNLGVQEEAAWNGGSACTVGVHRGNW